MGAICKRNKQICLLRLYKGATIEFYKQICLLRLPLSHALPYRHRATKSKLLNEVDSKARLCRRTPLNTQSAC